VSGIQRAAGRMAGDAPARKTRAPACLSLSYLTGRPVTAALAVDSSWRYCDSHLADRSLGDRSQGTVRLTVDLAKLIGLPTLSRDDRKYNCAAGNAELGL
jgi:hypothetical protein